MRKYETIGSQVSTKLKKGISVLPDPQDGRKGDKMLHSYSSIQVENKLCKAFWHIVGYSKAKNNLNNSNLLFDSIKID